jgi:hypothetical protein
MSIIYSPLKIQYNPYKKEQMPLIPKNTVVINRKIGVGLWVVYTATNIIVKNSENKPIHM